MDLLARFRNDSFFTAAGTAFGYGAILVVMFLVLFVVPFLAFMML